MSNDVEHERAWIGTLGDRADQRDRVASALALAHQDDGAYFVPVSTEAVDERVRAGLLTCRLDAAVLLVSADVGPTAETTRLLHLLGRFDVPVVVALINAGSPGSSRAVRKTLQKLTNETLGYSAPYLELSSRDDNPDKIKRLAVDAQSLAAKRKHRRGAGASSSKDYPFVISQADLDRLMRQNVRHALEGHRERGESVVVWRNGQVVELNPDSIFAE